jgi:hypothetical protein
MGTQKVCSRAKKQLAVPATDAVYQLEDLMARQSPELVTTHFKPSLLRSGRQPVRAQDIPLKREQLQAEWSAGYFVASERGISFTFAESAVNLLVSRRMVKQQQMHWTKRGAHLLLQVRAGPKTQFAA